MSNALASDLLTCSITSPDATPSFWTTAEIKYSVGAGILCSALVTAATHTLLPFFLK